MIGLEGSIINSLRSDVKLFFWWFKIMIVFEKLQDYKHLLGVEYADFCTKQIFTHENVSSLLFRICTNCNISKDL